MSVKHYADSIENDNVEFLQTVSWRRLIFSARLSRTQHKQTIGPFGTIYMGHYLQDFFTSRDFYLCIYYSLFSMKQWHQYIWLSENTGE